MSKLILSRLTGMILFLFSFQHFTYACGFNFVGDGSAFVRLVNNTQTKDYFVSNASYGTSLNNANLGSGLTTLMMTYGEVRTWESCTNNVNEAAVDVRSCGDIDLREAAGLAGGLDCAAELGGRGEEDQLLGGGSGRSLISRGMG